MELYGTHNRELYGTHKRAVVEKSGSLKYEERKKKKKKEKKKNLNTQRSALEVAISNHKQTPSAFKTAPA